ncbi:MAG: R3H domain-containing nucleic acid-binding protein [Actinomycetaceae bacterium]|nr:R3H domain-containing nucleic acid-binding protein [Actinomycetaceae bacterium]
MTEETPSKERLAQLVEEGDIAADYLEELLDIADLDGDIELDVENDRALVEIGSEDPSSRLERLVGEDGRVLDALQELTRLAVQNETGERSRLMLDIAGFRADRRRELTAIAEEAITRVRTTGQAVMLEPMNPFERKVCHDVAAREGLASESEGVEPNRCVVILPEAPADADDDESDAAAVDGYEDATSAGGADESDE